MNYVVTHSHSDLTNPIMPDSITKYKSYINKAKELNMKAIAFTEHGNIFNWVFKKQYCEEQGLKYIHGIEAYVTETLNEKTNDNYHVCMYAKNWSGVKELNNLSSTSFNRKDGHFYYRPRISIDELITTSDNIIITTACLGGILYSGTDSIREKFLNFLIRNKHRCFLEIQHHLIQEQIDYNRYLYRLNIKYGIPLITGTDTHSLNKEHAKGREVLQKAKNIHFDNEKGCDLTFKSYDQLIESYKKQMSIPMSFVDEAIENTNKLADMIEEFTLDKTPKYPKLYNNSEEVFKKKIVEGYKFRKKDKLPFAEQKKYIDRINEEFEAYKETNSIDYILFYKNVIDYAHSKGIRQGAGRGSSSASEICYLFDITDVDSLKYDLYFPRFINKERVSLADIDSDFDEKSRAMIKDYLFNFEGLYTSEIITFNTVADKGAIKEVARALEIKNSVAQEISDSYLENEEFYRNKYPELFYYVDLLKGVIVSIGSHPSGVLVSPIPINENVGLCSIDGNDNLVSQLNMKELESLFYVKFDILGLDTADIINRTYKYLNMENIRVDDFDFEDDKVWESIKNDTTVMFQWESQTASEYIKDILSDETYKKAKEINPNITRLDLLTIGNAGIRPCGELCRDKVKYGIPMDYGFEPINNNFKDTLSWCLYQEDIVKFLINFCGYSLGKADIVRKGVAKKGGTEKLLPEIHDNFIKFMRKTYPVLSLKNLEEIITPILANIKSASNYAFNKAHSLPYSINCYIEGYLRYYYPLEFLTSALNVYHDKIEKISAIISYAKKRNIEVRPIKFRYSKAEYFFDKDTNSIYKGIASIKYMNEQIAEELYQLKDNKYHDFISLLVDITENTTVNSKQLTILTTLGFFEEFGRSMKLLTILKEFQNGKSKYNKKHILKTKIKRVENLKQIFNTIPDKDIDVRVLIKAEYEFTGYVNTLLPLPHEYCMCLDIQKPFSNPFITLLHLNDGSKEVIKVRNKKFLSNPFNVYDTIKIVNKKLENKWIKTETGFEQIDVKEWILKEWKLVK